jgi:hypothetical protein
MRGDTTQAADTPARGITPAEFARRYRTGEDRVRAMIRRGELGALDLAPSRLGRPRYLIMPAHIEAFERRHAAATPAARPAPKRRRPAGFVDFFPD